MRNHQPKVDAEGKRVYIYKDTDVCDRAYETGSIKVYKGKIRLRAHSFHGKSELKRIIELYRELGATEISVTFNSTN